MSTSADAILSVRTQYDGSSLNAGMKESSVTVQTSSSQMSDALRGVVSSNNALADSINKVVSIRAAERTGSEASRAAAREEAAAKRELAAQTREATHAAHLFGMETGVEIPRALRGTLAQSAVLGPALAGMFPLLAAVGFVNIIAKAAKEAYEWGEKGREAAEKISEGFGDLSRKSSEENDAIALTNSKLQDQIDKLEKKPNNGLRTAILEAVVATDKLADHMRAAFKEADKLLKEQEVSAIKGAVLNIAPTSPAAKLNKEIEGKHAIAEGQRTWAMSEASTLTGQAQQDAIATANRAFNEAQVKILREGMERAKALGDQAEQSQRDGENRIGQRYLNTHGSNPSAGTTDYGALRESARGLQGLYGSEMLNYQGTQEEGSKSSKVKLLEQQKELTAEGKRTAEQVKKQREEAEKLKYLQDKLREAGLGNMADSLTKMPSETNAKRLNDLREGVVRAHVEMNKEIENSSKKANEAQIKALEKEKTKLEEAGKALDEYGKLLNENDIIKAKNKAALDEERVKTDLATGRTTAFGAAMSMAGIHAREYKSELDTLKQEMIDIANNGDLTKEQKDAKSQGVQNKIDQTQGKANVTGMQDNAKIAQTLAAPYLQANQLITSSMATGVNTWIEGHKRFGAAMKQSAQQIAMGFITSFEKIGEKWLQQHVMMRAEQAITHALGMTQTAASLANKTTATAAETTTTATAAATQAAATSMANVAAAASYAAVAAAAALASTAAIPIVGPLLAPAAASAMLTVGLGFAAMAAFEEGGIAGDGMRLGTAVPIVAHAGERILTTSQTQQFDSMVNNRSSSSAMHWNQTNNFQGSSDDQFRSQLLKHSSTIFRAGQRHLRQMGKG
jgi:hypothetical protein